MKQSTFLKGCRQFAVATLAVSLVVPGSTQAQESRPANTATNANVSSTIDALVAEALERNPELKFYQAEIAAAKGARKSAGLLANPEMTGSIGQKTVRGSGLTTEGVAWSVSLLQPFEWPGRMGLRKAIANRDIELAEMGLERFRTALSSRVRSLAYGLFVTQEKATAAREVAGRFQELREVLVQRDAAGLTPLLETRVIEATELTMQRKASEATLAMQAALLELNQLRNAEPEAKLAIKSTDLSFLPLEGIEKLIAQARTNNFELRVRAIELEQQGFRVDLAKTERYPAISVGPSVSEERAGDRERIIGISVSLPLPLWNRNRGNVESAVARQMQAETSLSLAERDVRRKVVEAALTYAEKLREMDRWRPDSAQHFRDAAALADRHYRLGSVPVATYVELQKQYLEAVEGLLDTKKEALEVAQSLELLTGLKPPLISTKQRNDKEPKP